jgi:hypothetical protein
VSAMLCPLLLIPGFASSGSAGPSISITLGDSFSTPVLGRVRLYLATACKATDPPPSAQCSDDQSTAQAFGVDTPGAGLAPGGQVVITASTLGYPRHSLNDVPAGQYCVQAELFRYSVYHRPDENLTLPTSCVSPGGGDGSYGSPPGTLYSDVKTVTFDPANPAQAPLALTLSHEVKPPAKLPGCSGKGADTKYIKTVTMTSKLLSAFWGQPIALEACVLLPWGFGAPAWGSNPEARSAPSSAAHARASHPLSSAQTSTRTPPIHSSSRTDTTPQSGTPGHASTTCRPRPT